MIHYHGTPCGGVSHDLGKFYLGRHAFISFARPDDLGIAMECCQSFALDNGAFSMWKRGIDVDWDIYIDWVASVSGHPGFDWWVIPDVIDGTERDNLDLINRYERIVPFGVPVYHFHEPLDYLSHLISRFPRIALGSSGDWPNPGTDSWWARMGEIMRVCCDDDGVPQVRLHGLRMLDVAIFTRLPLASADSTNAVRHAGDVRRFGMYVPPTSAQRAAVIASRIESHNSAPMWVESKQTEFCLS